MKRQTARRQTGGEIYPRLGDDGLSLSTRNFIASSRLIMVLLAEKEIGPFLYSDNQLVTNIANSQNPDLPTTLPELFPQPYYQYVDTPV